jgi:hypothetical protein
VKQSRYVAFVVIMLATAVSVFAVAQPRKPAPRGAVTKKPKTDDADGGTGLLAGKESSEPVPATGRDAGKGGNVLDQKTLDGGARVFRFGEVEVEGRLKSPQIVYFLRRVRAEFAAGDLGHRSFIRELDETKNEPSF